MQQKLLSCPARTYRQTPEPRLCPCLAVDIVHRGSFMRQDHFVTGSSKRTKSIAASALPQASSMNYGVSSAAPDETPLAMRVPPVEVYAVPASLAAERAQARPGRGI